MKLKIFCVLALCMPLLTIGQVKLAGKVTNPDGIPISSANVLLLNDGDTALVKGCMCNESGDYEMHVKQPGKYVLMYTAVGYRTCYSPPFELTALQGSKQFTTQVMQTDVRALTEVIVQAEKPLFQQQLFGTVVNVENSVLTKGSSVLQLLERSPGVYLDHHHNTLALNGKNGLMVMINGKVLRIPLNQVLDLLNGMSADNIEKIELLTSPPARYDADGDAGMINIVLKKNKKFGTNGSVTLSAGYGWGEKAGASMNLEHNNGKIDVFGSYSFSHDRTHEHWFAAGSQDMELLGGKTSFDFWSDIRPINKSHNAMAGLETWLNPKTKVGASINANFTHASSEVINRGDYIIEADSFLRLDSRTKGVANRRNLISSVYLEKKMAEGEHIELDADYIYYNNDNPTSVQSLFTGKNGAPVIIDEDLFAEWQRGISNTEIHVGVGKIDYTKQLNKKIKLEAGGKFTYTANAGLSGIQSMINGNWAYLPGKSNKIDMTESISAAYASGNIQINASTLLIVGLRYEYSRTRMEDKEKGQHIANRKLSKFFPAIFLSKKLNDESRLEASFTKRINRPSYIDLASNITYNDPVSVFTGNPLLQPTITNNFKIGYAYKDYSLSVLLGRDDNPIARYQIVADPDKNLIYISPTNVTWQNNLSLDLKIPVRLTSWWTMNYSAVGGWRQFKLTFTEMPVKKTWFDYSLYGSQTFTLPKNYSLEISGMYNSATYGGANKVAGFGMLNAGVKKELKKNGGTLQLSVADLLKSMHIDSYLGQVTDLPFLLRSHVNFNTESRKSQIFRLTYTRSFGNNDFKSQRKSNTGSKDESDRIR